MKPSPGLAPQAMARDPVGSHDWEIKMRSIHRDVVVVGAGATGLSAAAALKDMGFGVAVLEARDRVGGRLWNRNVDGHFFEVGGQWLSPDQFVLMETLEDLGLATYPRYREGENLYLDGDQRLTRYVGETLPTSASTAAEIATLSAMVEGLVAEIDPAAPWDHARAQELDAVPFDQWLLEHSSDREAVRHVSMFIGSAMLTKPGDTFSALQALQMAASIGSFERLVDPDFVLDRRVVGGLHRVPERLAARLSTDELFLSQAVERIHWTPSSVVVTTDALSVSARWAVVAVPPNMVGRIDIQPPIPEEHRRAHQQQTMGLVIKVQATYATPFWREAGLSGTAFSPYELVHEAYDNTAHADAAGTIVGFISDSNAVAVQDMSASVRRRTILESFANYFGEQALSPVAYCESDWAGEEWTRGAYGTSFELGGLSRYGAVRLEPVGPLRFGSSDTAAEGYMHVDGALRVGRRMAEEISSESARGAVETSPDQASDRRDSSPRP